MKLILLILLIFISIGIVILILLQPRSGGAGAVFGGGGGEIYRSRRGVEKLFHYATIALVFLFASISFLLIFIN